MKAQDVKWSFDRFVKVGGFPQRQMEQGSLTSVDQFEVVDDYTFRVKFLRSDKLTMPSLAIVVPSIYNSELCKKNATAVRPLGARLDQEQLCGLRGLQSRVVQIQRAGRPRPLRRLEGRHAAETSSAPCSATSPPPAPGARSVEKGDADLSPDLPPREIADIAPPKSSGSIPPRWRTPQISGAVDDHEALRRRAGCGRRSPMRIPYQK